MEIIEQKRRLLTFTDRGEKNGKYSGGKPVQTANRISKTKISIGINKAKIPGGNHKTKVSNRMATIKNGNIEIRAGSEDYIDLYLWHDNGSDPVDLSNRTGVTLFIVDFKTGAAVKDFPEGDKLEFISDANNNHIRLKQKKDDFSSKSEYGYYIIIYDLVGEHPIPDGRTSDEEDYYRFTVI